MTPLLPALFTRTFLLALAVTLFVVATLRLLYILPNRRFQPKPFRKQPIATRVLIVLGSGGHTHEMFYLLRDLDTRKYTHRTYVVSSGDAFSAQRAAEFENELEAREKGRAKATLEPGLANGKPETKGSGQLEKKQNLNERRPCVGPDHYNITLLPRARAIHQPLLTTPFTSLYTLLAAIRPLLSAPPLLSNQPPRSIYESAARDLPDLILTNGPATGVIVVLASLVLRFFDIRGAMKRGKCRTVYVESFARVTGLSLSGKLLVRVVDRFLVQWEGLAGRGGRAEFWGVLV